LPVDLLPDTESNDIVLQLLDARMNERVRSLLATESNNHLLSTLVLSLPPLGYDSGREQRTANLTRFNRSTDYTFETGERVTVTQRSEGINKDGKLALVISANGTTPRGDNLLRLSHFEGKLVEERRGLITGYGTGLLHHGGKRVGLR